MGYRMWRGRSRGRWDSAIAGGSMFVLLLVGVLSACGESTGSPEGRQAGGAQRPNVVVVMTDDQTLESLRVMLVVRREIGGAGATFQNYHSSYPLCCPSRATYLSGQYAHNNGVEGNTPPNGGYGALDHDNALPVWLEDAGYRTVHIGKYLNGYGEQNPREVPPGWSEWYGAVDPSTYEFWGYTLNENGEPKTYGDSGTRDPELYQTDVYADKAVDAIGRNADREEPFFLNVAFLAPHGEFPLISVNGGFAPAKPAPRHEGEFDGEPLPRPPSFNEEDVSDKPGFVRSYERLGQEEVDDMTNYYRRELESLLAVDEAVGRILGKLEETGELDNTLVVFTSDNGYLHGEHRIPDGKNWAYAPSNHLPLLMRGPGVPVGEEVDPLAANVDLAPTILDAADARAGGGHELDGVSLLRVAARPGRYAKRPLALEKMASVPAEALAQTPPEARQQTPPTDPNYSGILTRDYLYVEYTDGQGRELYDLEADPHQLDSKHDDPAYAETRAALDGALEEISACAGEGCSSARITVAGAGSP